MIRFNEYLIPEWAIWPLEYGDTADLSEQDILDLERFRAKLPAGAVLVYADESDYYFSWCNDISKSACTVAPAACYAPE